MDSATKSPHARAIEEENIALRKELLSLRRQLAAHKLDSSEMANPLTETPQVATLGWDRGVQHTLGTHQIERYSRQLLLGSFGVQAQDQLCRSSVLVVGAGGLGCPAAIYLAAAGVGRLGIVDKDYVEISNIHRQILHREQDIGLHKAVSVAAACKAINSSIKVEVHTDGFTTENAVALISDYDVVVDASDNAPTRYLISDACATTHRPLVSGAAIGTDGQLTVYCYGDNGPCYRCLFPEAPQPESCARCSEAGVLGPVPGVIGTLQALEAIKILSGVGEVLSNKMLLVDCLAGRFHQVKLRSRAADCVACGPNATIAASTIATFDYSSFTGQAYDDRGPPDLELLPASQRMTAADLKDSLLDLENRSANAADAKRILDVRPREQFAIAHLPGSISCPFDETHPEHFLPKFQQLQGITREFTDGSMDDALTWMIVCRRGNDSQRVVKILQNRGVLHVRDLKGGLLAWSRDADPSFPLL